MEKHRLHEELLAREVRILVVGCGGTGSAIIAGLPYLHQAMLVQGHPYGLHVTVMDGDTISPFNCVRQPFSQSEILNKGIVLVNRINLFWGLHWKAIPSLLTVQTLSAGYAGYGEPTLRPDIVVGCVDTRAARAIMHGTGARGPVCEQSPSCSPRAPWVAAAWATGSILAIAVRAGNSCWANLRTYSEIVDPALDDDSEPSCSAIEALERQECFVNAVLAQHALALLARLFRYGEISHHGGFVNIATSRSVPLAVDPLLWHRIRKRARPSPRSGHRERSTPADFA
jgi:hypothetical protein